MDNANKVAKNYYLLRGARPMFTSLVRDVLVTFSVKALRQAKLVTSNFKTGLEFLDFYYLRSDLKKLISLIIKAVNKDLPFLTTSIKDINTNNTSASVLNPPIREARSFIVSHRGNVPNLYFKLVKDKSLVKYCERINRYLSDVEIPVSLRLEPGIVTYEGDPTFDGQTPEYWKYMLSRSHYLCMVDINVSNSVQSMTLYRTLLFLPQILKVIKTLSRKAFFEDENVRNLFRYHVTD